MIRKAVKLVKGKIMTKPLKNDGSKIDYLVSAMKDMKKDMCTMKADIQDIKQRGDATFEEVGNIKVEITEIKIDITEIKDRVSSIESKLDQKADVARVETLESKTDIIGKHLKLSFA